jgi:3-hydroxyacyl-CoA dehydrogenase
MDYINRIKKSAVLGAAGKMGSGISLLMAQEMVAQALKPGNENTPFELIAVDVSEEALQGLKDYIFQQSRKKATKKAEDFRKRYPVFAGKEDEEVGLLYAEKVFSVLKLTTRLEDAARAGLVFEAVSENPELKTRLFDTLEKASSDKDIWYFTNTSSVPIHLLDEKASLDGRILGFHFYNPPAVQRLVELILTSRTKPGLRETALELARNMGKIIVPANDHAGFIGNGHFMRDALYGIAQAEKLANDMPVHEAIYRINTVSMQYLIRPMGVFQLIDYVGIDVVRYILGVMNPYYPAENLHSELLDTLFDQGIKGGQHHDGSQKDGFLQYKEGKAVAVYNPTLEDYVKINEFRQDSEQHLGAIPAEAPRWKDVIRDTDKEAKLSAWFTALGKLDSQGAQLACDYLRRSREIGRQLVRDGIALSEKDVNTVLLTGFFHAYGPINDYLI